MRKTAAAGSVEPNGSIIMWLTGAVLGVCAGLLVVYHVLLSSRAAPMPAPVAQAAPAGFIRASAKQSVAAMHDTALRAATKEERR